MKNLDKPLSQKVLCGTGFWAREFNDYHGTSFANWNEVVRAIYPNPGKDVDLFYQSYLEWCKVANSPLYKALR